MQQMSGVAPAARHQEVRREALAVQQMSGRGHRRRHRQVKPIAEKKRRNLNVRLFASISCTGRAFVDCHYHLCHHASPWGWGIANYSITALPPVGEGRPPSRLLLGRGA